MPTHNLTAQGSQLDFSSLRVLPAQRPSIEPTSPRLSEPAINTLNDLQLNDTPLHEAFKHWILGYGVSFVTHAIAFERAAEVVSCTRTREAFLESITGEREPTCTPAWRGFPVSQLKAAIYIPPCHPPRSGIAHGTAEPTITLLCDDLANCFFDPINRQQGGALRLFISRAQDLDSLLTPKLLLQGLQFVAKGWERSVSEYLGTLHTEKGHFILGANHLIHYYQEVIETCAARTRARLSSLKPV
jgi:hypothetical protein